MSRGYASQSYDIVRIETPEQGPRKHMNVLFEVISNHGEAPEPLDEVWWRSFRSSMDELPERLFLMVTERPVAFDVIRPDMSFPAVSFREFSKEQSEPYAYAVFVDCSAFQREQWPLGIGRSRKILMELAPRVSRPEPRPKGRNWSESLMVWTGERSTSTSRQRN